MFKHPIAICATSICIAFSAPLLAEEQDELREIRRVQALLTLINGEMKADLDQIQMLQESLKLNARAAIENLPSPDPESFEAANAAKRQALQRDAAISQRLDAILARNAGLDARKQQLLDRLLSLGATATVRPVEPANKASAPVTR